MSVASALVGLCCLSILTVLELYKVERVFVLVRVEFAAGALAVRELSSRNRLKPNRENRKTRTGGGVATADLSCLLN